MQINKHDEVVHTLFMLEDLGCHAQNTSKAIQRLEEIRRERKATVYRKSVGDALQLGWYVFEGCGKSVCSIASKVFCLAMS